MRILGVIDLLGGQAVHARRGERHTYAPVATAAGVRVDGDALALARAYVDALGIGELYVADLDALMGGVRQDAQLAAIVTLGVRLWVDAGLPDAHTQRGKPAGPLHTVVALETLPSFTVLAASVRSAGRARVAFSLDLHDGRPLSPGGWADGVPVGDLARRAADAGAGTLIVIDLARVGANRGADLQTIEAVREAVPDVALLAGGGVRGPDDLRQLGETGCDGVLVATALQDGRLTAGDVVAAGRLRHQASGSR